MNERGVATYSRGVRGESRYESVIDLVLIGDVLKDQVRYELPDVKGFDSDHAVSSLTIDMRMARKSVIRYGWDGTDIPAYRRFIEQRLRTIARPRHPTEHDVDEV